MCIDSKSKLYPLEMKAVCSKLLELAATDDLPAFIDAIEKSGCDVNEASFWYSKSFHSNKMGFKERTPIMIASLYGSTNVLKYILASGKVDVNRAYGSDGSTPLHCAAAGGSWPSIEVVKLLIDASGDINSLDTNGNKPGDVIAPAVKPSIKNTLEFLLNGRKIVEAIEKKDYPIDVSLPDINIGLYGSDEFRMYSFKVTPCSRAYTHDWTECPFVHPGENARRRDPRKYNYTCVPCPDFKKGSCAKGDACEYAHGVFESWLHPAQYRTRLCKDETGCPRKVCFFAHKRDELRPLYASTGSGLPSPKSTLTTPMSSSVACSSPVWHGKMNQLTPPVLQLQGSRLKTSVNAREVEFDMELLGLDTIRTQRHNRQFVEEMANLSTNLDDVFGSLNPYLHGQSPKVNNSTSSPMGHQHIRQNTNQLRASYPSIYGFDSSAAVAAAVMNSRSTAFAKRSQSFVDRNGASYRAGLSSPHNSPGPMQAKLLDWGAPNGRVDWGFNGEEVNKLRKSASFGFRGGNGPMAMGLSPMNVDGPDVSWVNTLVKDVPTPEARVYGMEQKSGSVHDMMPLWVDQMYMEQEQMVA